MTTVSVPADIHELLAASELVDVRAWEERARRLTSVAEDAEESEVDMRISTTIGTTDEALHCRFRVTIDDHVARYVADFETVYLVEGYDPRAIPEPLRREFAERVAFMATYPHARASVLGAAGRLGLRGIVMPLVRQGDFSIGEQMDRSVLAAVLSDDAGDDPSENSTLSPSGQSGPVE